MTKPRLTLINSIKYWAKVAPFEIGLIVVLMSVPAIFLLGLIFPKQMT